MIQRIVRIDAEFETPPLGVQVDAAGERQIEGERSRTRNRIAAGRAELSRRRDCERRRIEIA